MAISDLPALNATFNLVSTVFISMGWYFIRHGAWRRHMACMITASSKFRQADRRMLRDECRRDA